jgi:hypothetical protein
MAAFINSKLIDMLAIAGTVIILAPNTVLFLGTVGVSIRALLAS